VSDGVGHVGSSDEGLPAARTALVLSRDVDGIHRSCQADASGRFVAAGR
jgi:hypothetical protein